MMGGRVGIDVERNLNKPGSLQKECTRVSLLLLRSQFFLLKRSGGRWCVSAAIASMTLAEKQSILLD